MGAHQDILISTSILVKAPRDDAEMREVRDRIAARMKQAIQQSLSSESVEWSRQCTNFRYLEKPDLGTNARRCFYCSAWATDRTKLEAIDGLLPGCELDGRWVCDQCIDRHDQSKHTT